MGLVQNHATFHLFRDIWSQCFATLTQGLKTQRYCVCQNNRWHWLAYENARDPLAQNQIKSQNKKALLLFEITLIG